MDITVISGKLDEVYMPHWICTGKQTQLIKLKCETYVNSQGKVLSLFSSDKRNPHHALFLAKGID